MCHAFPHPSDRYNSMQKMLTCTQRGRLPRAACILQLLLGGLPKAGLLEEHGTQHGHACPSKQNPN
jgi:hypothetical protein